MVDFELLPIPGGVERCTHTKERAKPVTVFCLSVARHAVLHRQRRSQEKICNLRFSLRVREKMKERKECGISGPTPKHRDKKGSVSPSDATAIGGRNIRKKVYQHDTDSNVGSVSLGLIFTERVLHTGNEPSSRPCPTGACTLEAKGPQAA